MDYEALIQPAAALIGLIISGLVSQLLMVVTKRAKLDVTEKREAQLEYLAARAALWAEEYSASLLRATLPTRAPAPAPPTGAAKLEQAVAYVMERRPDVTQAEAEAIINSILPELRLGAARGSHLGNDQAGTSRLPTFPPTSTPTLSAAGALR